MFLARLVNDGMVRLMQAARRLDPYYRDSFDRIFRPPLEALAQSLINVMRENERLRIAEERVLPGEAGMAASIVRDMSRFTREHYPNGGAERAGNTKTYGVVRASFEILPGLPERLRRGLFAQPATYPAYVRFAGPGPLAPPDMDDNGILSIGIKLMGVPGPKLLDDERFTVDFTGISAPTFTTPNVVENVKLQRNLAAGTPALYFLNPFDSHYLDALMQGLYARAHANPLEARYWSCVPYLFGEGQAAQYTIRPREPGRSKVPHRPSENYLREAMARTLATRDVILNFEIQLQTGAHEMPLENASVRWPEKLSPFIPVARISIPKQTFDSPAQLAFARNLKYNPWHTVPEHRPLGNQNRARRIIYAEMSKLRQSINGEPHIEPDGTESF